MRWVIYVNVANIAYVFRGRNLATVLIFFRYRASAYTTLDGLCSFYLLLSMPSFIYNNSRHQFCKSG